MSIKHIITHPGGAHKDDFLACSLMIYSHGVPVLRKEPSEAEVGDASIAVVDVGGEHEPTKMNFDHHQFPADYAPTCALSLVLRHLGLYEDARQYCDWLETSEWLDTRGAVKTSKWLGIERSAMAKLNSPVDITLLRRFAKQERHEAGQPVYEVMRMIGEDMVSFLKGMRERMKEIERQSEIWEIDEKFKVVFIPRVEPMIGEPSAGLGRYIESNELDCVAMVYPDRRGSGYGLSRYNDDLRLNFTRIGDCDDVHFAHKSGFMAKSSAIAPDRLRELLSSAWVG
ncbi:MYG1 family protein [Rubritalea profundi]|uniref:Metal-dependent hydrolase n=1 Tax=Rubritalea profundi TaxID=1658618 RepID=A0A2S7TWM7_9BACT|nr:MYG1 family protein [Rubritalea profundi]PQJ27146.1 hypothetical protein BSZ32_00615 [Rubritalea profundi]